MTYEKSQNIVGLESLARTMAQSLVTAGFLVDAADGASSTTIPATAKKIVLSASATVDTQEATQPWSVIIAASNTNKTLSIHVLPTSQVSSTYEAVKRNATSEVGRVSVDGSETKFFIDLVNDWKIDAAADVAAYPFSCDVSVSDHGFAVHVNAEGLDNSGTAFSWLVVQRGVIAETGIADPLSPLFAVFSCGGGQNGNPDTLSDKSIQRFTVIERDISSATSPISAVVPTPDGIPVINPLQQVMIAEGNKAIVLFPHMINSHRYLYHVVLDMIGYTSADVISAGSRIELTPASVKQVYTALNANGKDNRGMRVLFPVEIVSP